MLQNIHMLAAYRIIHGLLPVLGLTPEDSRAKESAAAKFKWYKDNVLIPVYII